MQREIDDLKRQVNVQNNDTSPVNMEVTPPSPLSNVPSVTAVSNSSERGATITVAHEEPSISLNRSSQSSIKTMHEEGPELKHHKVIDCFNLYERSSSNKLAMHLLTIVAIDISSIIIPTFRFLTLASRQMNT